MNPRYTAAMNSFIVKQEPIFMPSWQSNGKVKKVEEDEEEEEGEEERHQFNCNINVHKSDQQLATQKSASPIELVSQVVEHQNSRDIDDNKRNGLNRKPYKQLIANADNCASQAAAEFIKHLDLDANTDKVDSGSLELASEPLARAGPGGGMASLNKAAASRAKFAIKSYTISSGSLNNRYHSHSLVSEAKLNTQRNRQLIEEVRRQASIYEEEDCGFFDNWLTTDGKPTNLKQQQQLDTDTSNGLPKPPAGGGTTKELVRQATIKGDQAAKLAERCLVDYPRHISELDYCNHLLIKYEPELDPTHPGFHDPEYRERRKAVAQAAFEYRHGQVIPDIEYNDHELATWRIIYLRLKGAYDKFACWQQNKAIKELEQQAGYGPDSIPQLQRVSDFLQRRTGWRLRPVAGLLSARDFLTSLAFRVFQTTQYIRHWGNPEHSVEPDCIHELMGHIPMLCDPEFAQFSQELGLASLGASDEQIERLATLYWFTVEFGLCRESGQLKCYGAGLLSSYGEMEHALESGKAKLKEFIPEQTAIEPYDDADYQLVYFVAESFDDAKAKMKDYAACELKRDYELAYDPLTDSIKQLDSLDQLEIYSRQVSNDFGHLCAAIDKLCRLNHHQQDTNNLK